MPIVTHRKFDMQIHPQFLKKNGKKEFVVLPIEEFITLQELLADAEDVLDLRETKQQEADEPTVPLSHVKKRFGLGD